MNIYIHNPNSRWVLDDIISDYKKYSRHTIIGDLKDDPQIFWSVNLFSFPILYPKISKGCKSFIHVHHIDETKLNEYNFKVFNCANGCIVPNDITKRIAGKYLSIPIYKFPYWLLSRFHEKCDEKEIDKLKSQISDGEVLIGSFVKDGNGKLGDTAKLSKGPDVFVKIVEKLNKVMKIKVVLAGYGRNYVVKNLKEKNIPYVYLPYYKNIPLLYDCIDWYIVTSRCEGGPQSILESSYRNTNILSTRVGLAPEVLHPDCLYDSIDECVEKIVNNLDKKQYNNKSVLGKFMPEKIIPRIDEFFEGINK